MDTTLLLIPGLLCDRAVWQQTAAELAYETTFQVAEHGLSNSLTAMARNVLENSRGPLLLAGHSMGGRVALEAFRLAPGRIRGLALLDTGCHPLPFGAPGILERDERLRLLDLARRDGMRAMAHDWVQRMVDPARLDDASLMEAISGMMARRSPEHLEAQIQALLQRPDATPLLGEISCPTLLLCGEQDTHAPPAQHLAMHERICGSEFVVLPSCGHMAPMERPPAVADALRRWLARVQAA